MVSKLQAPCGHSLSFMFLQRTFSHVPEATPPDWMAGQGLLL